MAGFTVANLRPRLGQKLGPYVSGTADGSGSTTTILKDAGVLDRYADNLLRGRWIYFTSGSDSGTWRHLSASDQSDATITWVGAISTAPHSVTYEIYQFEPDMMAQALRDAAKVLYAEGLLSARRDLVVAVANSPVRDPAFTDWTTSTGLNTSFWTANTSSVAQQTSNSRLGGFTCRVQTSNGNIETVVSNPDFMNDLEDNTFTVKAIVKTATAASGAVGFYDGTSNTKSSYHTGGGAWEVLEKEITGFTAQAANPSVRVFRDSGGSIDVGLVWVKSGIDLREYALPTLLPSGPDEVWLSRDLAEKMYATPGRALWDRLDNWHFRQGHQVGSFKAQESIWFDSSLPGEYLIRAVGSAPVLVSTTDADTVEIEEEDTEILLAQAVIELVSRMRRGGTSLPSSLSGIEAEATATLSRLRQKNLEAGSGIALPLGWGF